MMEAIGSFTTGSAGQQGLVVARRTVAETGDGRELVELRIQSRVAADEITPGARITGMGVAVPTASAAFSAQLWPFDRGARADGTPETLTRGASGASNGGPFDLDPSERAIVERLRARDSAVKTEEEAHAAVAGDLAGAISYDTVVGPDGQRYAVGGSVGIRAATASTPEEVREIGGRLAAAANAATNPSAADLSAARDAYAMTQQASQSMRWSPDRRSTNDMVA